MLHAGVAAIELVAASCLPGSWWWRTRKSAMAGTGLRLTASMPGQIWSPWPVWLWTALRGRAFWRRRHQRPSLLGRYSLILSVDAEAAGPRLCAWQGSGPGGRVCREICVHRPKDDPPPLPCSSVNSPARRVQAFTGASSPGRWAEFALPLSRRGSTLLSSEARSATAMTLLETVSPPGRNSDAGRCFDWLVLN